MRLSDGMLAIAAGSHHRPIDISGSDEVAEMGRVVEIFRRNTLERDELLAEKAQAADRLEQQVKERTAELAQSVEELRGYADRIIVPIVTRGRFGALRTEIDPEFDLVGAAVEAGFRGGLDELLREATKDSKIPIDDIFDGIFGRKKK